MRKHYKLTATIYDKRGRVLSSAENSYEKTHPYQYRLACQSGRPDAIYLHAEIAAILKLKNLDKAYRILVERYNSKGEPTQAKPCQICSKAIELAGISIIEHT